jgi:hypothetical protein
MNAGESLPGRWLPLIVALLLLVGMGGLQGGEASTAG